MLHTATYDYEGLGDRMGQRAVSLGEKPYFDPKSKSRKQALAEEASAEEAKAVPIQTKPVES